MLAQRQILGRRVGYLVAPADRAVAGTGRSVAHRGGEHAGQRVGRRSGDRGRVGVGQVDVVERDRAAVGEIGARGILGNRSGKVGNADGRQVIGAIKDHRHADDTAICRRDIERRTHALTDGKIVEC